jgi:pimeloyl-ACP methyl ester carboxylesterase
VSGFPLVSAESFAVAADGTRLYVRQRVGLSEVTAVLCDGIACDGFIWKYLWNDLAKHTRVAHWNYRGHGRSGSPRDPARIELVDHARDLETVRELIGNGPVVLVGHSMGCQVVLEAMREHRKNVRGLILVCGASGRVTHTFKGTNILAQVLPGLIERVDAHPGLFRALFGHVPADIAARAASLLGEVDGKSIDLKDMVPYMRHMVDIDLRMFLRMLRSAGEHSAADLLPTLDVPALVVAGDRDTFTPPQYAEQMAASLPNGELFMIAGGTHVAPLEQPALVGERVERFLRERIDA